MKVIYDLEVNQEFHCKKACREEEFKISYIEGGLGFGQLTEWVNKSWNPDIPENHLYKKTHHVVGYKFALPKFNRGIRSRKPYKTVKKEYLINTLISLIGTVGGTMGMFVGFSFIGTSEWLSGNIKSIVAKLKLRAKESSTIASKLSDFGNLGP